MAGGCLPWVRTLDSNKLEQPYNFIYNIVWCPREWAGAPGSREPSRHAVAALPIERSPADTMIVCRHSRPSRPISGPYA